jgi:hypothetical protein
LIFYKKYDIIFIESKGKEIRNMKCHTLEGKSLYQIQKNIQAILDDGNIINQIAMSTTKVGYETYYSVILILN